jgi:hypothetical protein
LNIERSTSNIEGKKGLAIDDFGLWIFEGNWKLIAGRLTVGRLRARRKCGERKRDWKRGQSQEARVKRRDWGRKK